MSFKRPFKTIMKSRKHIEKQGEQLSVLWGEGQAPHSDYNSNNLELLLKDLIKDLF